MHKLRSARGRRLAHLAVGLFAGMRLAAVLSVACSSAVLAAPDPRCAARVSFYQPPGGVVSSPAIALRVAEIYLVAIYGAKQIASETPLKVTIVNEVWRIRGMLPAGSIGGVADIEICQSTGQVLRIFHGK